MCSYVYTHIHTHTIKFKCNFKLVFIFNLFYMCGCFAVKPEEMGSDPRER